MSYQKHWLFVSSAAEIVSILIKSKNSFVSLISPLYYCRKLEYTSIWAIKWTVIRQRILSLIKLFVCLWITITVIFVYDNNNNDSKRNFSAILKLTYKYDYNILFIQHMEKKHQNHYLEKLSISMQFIRLKKINIHRICIVIDFSL